MVVKQRVFHFGAVYIFAAAQHHILGAIHQVDKTVLVHTGYIAGVQPAIDDGLGAGLGPIEVAADDRRAAHQQFAEFAHGPGRAALVYAFGLEGRHRRPHAGGPVEEELQGHSRDDAAGLGHAVAGAGPRSRHGPGHLAHQIGLHRRATAANGFQG